MPPVIFVPQVWKKGPDLCYHYEKVIYKDQMNTYRIKKILMGDRTEITNKSKPEVLFGGEVGGEIPADFYRYREMTGWQRFWGHMNTVHMHRKYVRQGCFKIGLCRQGLFHDLSKYSPTEFLPSIKYYDGHRSPNAVDRRFNGYSRAWLHHKGRNKHHYEYWIDFMDAPVDGPFGCKMPLRFVAEMVCDRRAACMAYHGKSYQQKDAWEYYARTKDFIVLHKDTRAVLEHALITMRDEGEEACFAFLREILAKTKGLDYTAESLGLNK